MSNQAGEDGDSSVNITHEMKKVHLREDNATINSLNHSENNCNDRISEQEYPDILIQRQLFGGAISMSLPSHWKDVSLIRQVPDHQEVYQDISSTGCKNDGTYCCILEILERQDVNDSDAIEFFFHDLVGDDDDDCDYDGNKILYQQIGMVGRNERQMKKPPKCASNHEMIIIPNLSSHAMACSCVGTKHAQRQTQTAHDANTTEGQQSYQEGVIVYFEMCVIRLESIQTDILITLSRHETITKGTNKISTHENETTRKTKEKHGRLFCDILSSLKVNDWSLFA